MREGRLLRRAERGRNVRPSGRRGELLTLVLDAEALRQRGLSGEIEVERDPAASDEGPEVDDRALERGNEPAGRDPLDGDDRLAGPLGGLEQRVCLEDARRREAGGVVEGVAGAVEGVVRRTVLAGPGARRERVPPHAGVRREALQQPVVACHAALQQILEGGHDSLGGVALHQVGPHTVRREQDRLLRPLGSRVAMVELLDRPLGGVPRAAVPRRRTGKDERPERCKREHGRACATESLPVAPLPRSPEM